MSDHSVSVKLSREVRDKHCVEYLILKEEKPPPIYLKLPVILEKPYRSGIRKTVKYREMEQCQKPGQQYTQHRHETFYHRFVLAAMPSKFYSVSSRSFLLKFHFQPPDFPAFSQRYAHAPLLAAVSNYSDDDATGRPITDEQSVLIGNNCKQNNQRSCGFRVGEKDIFVTLSV